MNLKKHKSFFKGIKYKSFGVYLLLFLFSVFITTIAYTAPPSNYTDTGSYPQTAWPLSLNTGTTTISGGIGASMIDPRNASDASYNTPPASKPADFSSNGASATSFFSGDGQIMYIRYRLADDPTSNSNGPYGSVEYSFLMDTTGDGFWDFGVRLSGSGITGFSDNTPDDINVYYNNVKSQLFPSAATNILWKQDSARKPDGSGDNIDGEPKPTNKLVDWEVPCGITPIPADCHNFGRTRVSSVATATGNTDTTGDYFLDIQVPVAAFDATAPSLGGPKLTSSSKFGFAAATSNSNADPLQKDFLYNGAFTPCASCPFPTSEIIDPTGTTYAAPTITSVTAGACTAPVTLKAQVNDALTVNSGIVVDTITEDSSVAPGFVKFYYWYDSNGNGVADSGESSWNLIFDSGTRRNTTTTRDLAETTDAPSASRTTVGEYTTRWDTSSLPVTSSGTPKYLIKVIVKDQQGNITDSSTQTNPGAVIATGFNNSCGATFDYGDAPDTYGTSFAGAGFSVGGARHSSPAATLRIGTNAGDIDSNNITTGTGTTDDTTGTPDDEDGFTTLPSLSRASTSYSISVPVNNTSGSAAFLRAWIDFNRNGVFDDGEASDLPGNTANVANGTATTSPVTLTWSTIPADIAAGATYARLRITNTALAATDDIGAKVGGEVEDYPITITQPTDYGDLPDGYKTLDASNGARHVLNSTIKLGALIDADSDGIPSTSADGDNLNNTNDEDGVIFNPALNTGILQLDQTNTVRINASVAGFASMWIDYNDDGDFADTGEQVLNDSAVVIGNNDKTFNISNNITYGYKYIRVRYSTTAGQSNTTTGLANDGEVEDYRLYLASRPNNCTTLTAPSGAIGNGSFEDSPAVATFIQTAQANIPYWNTTSPDGLIEIWKDGFDGGSGPTPSNTGTQFAELNATQASALYQDVITTPGSTLYIHLAHRGRAGVDVAAAKVGAPGGSLTTIGTLSDGNTSWGEYDFSYVVPAGQTITRLQFESVSTSGGNPAVGNFIDSVVAFSSAQCFTTDFGDAPDTYKTLNASGGAKHTTTFRALKMGANVGDTELDAPATLTGTQDDSTGTDDEDGVASFTALNTGTTSYSVTVNVTNNIGAAANLMGWIDFNRNNVFDSGEASSGLSVVNGTSGSNVTLNWSSVPRDIKVGATYARFRITTDTLANTDASGTKNNGEVEDYPLTIAQGVDFGDAPDTYKSLDASSGAKHNIDQRVFMGTNSPDNETDAPATLTGTQDDTTGTSDDEDGITSFNTLNTSATSYSATVKVTNNIPSTSANLVGWIDFNGNGIFDTGEASLVTSVATGTNGTNATLTWSSIPTDIKAGSVYARIRMTTDTLTATAADAIGLKTNGEVEDYPITISSGVDYGDAPDVNYKTLLASGGASHVIDQRIFMGTNFPDNEADGQPSVNALGDGVDEDGVTSFTALNTSATSYSATVKVTNNIPSTSANLVGWIDFNGNGIFDTGEASLVTSVATGTNGTNATLTWSSIPTDIKAGSVYARIRMTTDTLTATAADAIGLKTNGEVEDYTITISQGIDYGDAPNSYLTTLASGGASHVIDQRLFMGTNSTDSEATGVPTAGADGDDLAVTDDEDAVSSIPALPITATSYSLTVKVTNNIPLTDAYLIGWIDFNRNNVFDSGEASTRTTVVTGTTGSNVTLNWTTLPAMTIGASYVRLRFTTDNTIANTDSAGAKPNGEVEDYPISIVNAQFSFSGTVFTDMNYGGGAGRSLAASAGVVRSGATVELYDSTGAYVSSTTTNASGLYTFSTITAGTYTVRVVNSTVTSNRPGYTSANLAVQTFRTNASSGTAVSVTDHVGGEAPEKVDAGINTTSATLASLTTASTVAQSVTTLTGVTTTITGVDFGYNFDTIVNKNDSGQGSLRQFVLNSNALANTGLSQVGQSAGQEVSIFMIPNGVANPGQNTSYTNQLTGYGAALITLSGGALPNITDANTSIDGSTQTKNVKTATNAETNSGQVGSGGFVGVSQTSLQRFNNPEIEILGSNNVAITSNNTATGFQLKNTALANLAVVLGNSSLFQDNLVGMHANGTEGGTTQSGTYGVRIGNNTSNVTVRHNYVKTDNSGIRREGGGSNMLIEYNEVTSPTTQQTDTYDGILIIDGGLDDRIQYNYVHDIRGSGSELGYNSGADVKNLLVQENTYDNNGKNKDGSPSPEPMNLDVKTIGSGSVVKIYRNIISNAGGMGVLVDATNRVWITQNSIFQNGKVLGYANLGIDLVDVDINPNLLNPGALASIGVNPNDGLATLALIFSGKANSGTDYPIVTSGIIKGTTLRLKGYVGTAPGQTVFGNATLEFFKADDDGNNNGPVIVGDGKSVPHGEGKIYISSCTSASDGTFDCSFYNVTNVVPGDGLTATATNSNFDTSEFSNLTVTTEDPFLFAPDNNSNALPGATVYYSHTIVSPVAGIVNLTATSQKGWTYTFFNDVNGNGLLDSGDTAYSGANPSLGDVYTLYPTHITKLLVKLQVPIDTPANTVDTFKITATLTPSVANSVPLALSVTDITTSSSLSSGVLKLIKTVDKTTVKSGQQLTYTITYTNTGNSVLSNISIEDIVPEGTTFSSISVNGVHNPTTKKLTWTIPGTLGVGQSSNVSFTVNVN